jgi:hypothetical protein
MQALPMRLSLSNRVLGITDLEEMPFLSYGFCSFLVILKTFLVYLRITI